jgi:putative transposase
VRTAPALIIGEATEAVIADKAYDSDEFLSLIVQMGAEAVIPPKANRVKQREYDENLYADRNKAVAAPLNVSITKPSNTED